MGQDIEGNISVMRAYSTTYNTPIPTLKGNTVKSR